MPPKGAVNGLFLKQSFRLENFRYEYSMKFQPILLIHPITYGHGHLCSLWLRGQCACVHRADSLALLFRCTENMINDIFHLFSMMIIYTPFALQARISPSTALQKCRGQQFSFIFSLLFFFANNFYLHICLPKIKEKKRMGNEGKEAAEQKIYIIKGKENSQRWWMMNNDWSHVASPWNATHSQLFVIYGCWRFYVCLCQFRSREITYISFVSPKISRWLAKQLREEKK